MKQVLDPPLHTVHTSSTLFSNRGQVGKANQRLDFIDGLRGLAALAVTVLHAFQIYGMDLAFAGIHTERGGLSNSVLDRLIFFAYDKLFRHGHYAVEIFIVISGFSLMIAVARSCDRKIRGGLQGFVIRRVRRILPPYYAALAISLLIIAVVPGMNTKQNVYWDIALPSLDSSVILSHIFFLHNLSPFDWGQRINPPMWSIAVEEQIYWLFPLIILVWRKLGSIATLCITIAFGIVQLFWGSRTFPFSMSWYVGLFGMGMFAASVNFSQRPSEIVWRERFHWGKLAVGSTLLFGIVTVALPQSELLPTWLIDSLLGVAVACALVYFAKYNEACLTEQPLLLRLFKSRIAVQLGFFSYSLYLMHVPTLALLALVCNSLPLSITWSYIIVLVVGIPSSILGSYAFHVIFERPFMGAVPSPRRYTQLQTQ